MRSGRTVSQAIVRRTIVAIHIAVLAAQASECHYSPRHGIYVHTKTSSGGAKSQPTADQRAAPEKAHWTTFLNQEAAVFRGTEILARRFNYPVVYFGAKRIKRGFYRVHMEMLFEHPKRTSTGEISDGHTKRLERDILDQPEIWLL